MENLSQAWDDILNLDEQGNGRDTLLLGRLLPIKAYLEMNMEIDVRPLDGIISLVKQRADLSRDITGRLKFIQMMMPRLPTPRLLWQPAFEELYANSTPKLLWFSHKIAFKEELVLLSISTANLEYLQNESPLESNMKSSLRIGTALPVIIFSNLVDPNYNGQAGCLYIDLVKASLYWRSVGNHFTRNSIFKIHFYWKNNGEHYMLFLEITSDGTASTS